MTIEEAIKGLEARAFRNNRSADICEMKDGHTLQYHNYRDGAKEKYQIAEWLKDYSRLLSEHRTGHWEWVQYDSNPNIGNWHCSECRTIIPHMPEETDNIPIYKWCPMCGVKMKEGD